MQQLKVLNEQKVLGKNFKVYGTAESPLFMAKDVAEWIDYAYKDNRKISRDVSKMLSTVDEEEKCKNTLNLGGEDCSHGGIRENIEIWFLTEDGLYEVLMQSRKPIAKQFKKEVKNILKTIRRSGGYVNNAEKMVDIYFSDIPDQQKVVIQGLLVGIEKKQKRIDILSKENDLLTQKALEWADRPIINALVRAYAHSIDDDYSGAWREFKKELLYRHGINLNARKTVHLNNGGSKKKGTLDFINDDELPQAISTAVAMCKDNNVDISDIIEKKAS